MELNKLLDQWNETMVHGNSLAKEIDDFENILNRAREGKVCVHKSGEGTTYIDTVLDNQVMDVLKEIVINTLAEGRDLKVAELEQLIGKAKEPVKEVINPDIKKAVKDLEQEHGKDKLKDAIGKLEPKQELTVELVKSLYHEQNMTLDEVAKEIGTNRTALYRFITQHNLRKPSKRDQEIFRDGKLQQQKPR